MQRLIHPVSAFCFLLTAMAGATPDEAQRIETTWKLAVERWTLETKAASTPEQQAKAWSGRPELASYVQRMWQVIGGSLDRDWTLPHVAWFLRTSATLANIQPDGSMSPMFPDETTAVLKAIEEHHLDSPGLVPVCMALTAMPDPRSLAILERIESSHTDARVQGVAALGAAVILKSLGEDADLMRKRLTYLRKAIIQSSDVELGGTSVAKVAEDELYVIRFLSKGRVAPDLAGNNSAGRPLRLSDHIGKVIVLMFWSSTMPDAEQVIEITAELDRKFAGRPLKVIGVNHDPLEKLRSMEGEGPVTWQNLSDPANRLSREFRIASLPTVFVLDGERKIQYVGAPGSFAELTAEALVSEIENPPGNR